MTKRTFNDKHNNQWEWEETPETVEALKQLHRTPVVITDLRESSKFAGNYQGPLYAPHPDIKKDGKKTD